MMDALNTLNMKNELNHFMIGASYGGNQEWFSNFMMRLGGCAAETACDSSVYFAREKGITEAYPYDAQHLTRKEYVEFSKIMEPYLRPRRSGIDRLDIFIDGYDQYLKDRGIDSIAMTGLDGDEPVEKARAALMSQIDRGLPIPVLLLRHKNRKFKDYNWHWFLINGYKTLDENHTLVKAVTYSEYQWLPLEDLWNTGFDRKGGLILYDIKDSRS